MGDDDMQALGGRHRSRNGHAVGGHRPDADIQLALIEQRRPFESRDETFRPFEQRERGFANTLARVVLRHLTVAIVRAEQKPAFAGLPNMKMRRIGGV